MTVEAREAALRKLRADLFHMPQILKRISKISAKGFPMAHITSFFVQYPQGRAFRSSRASTSAWSPKRVRPAGCSEAVGYGTCYDEVAQRDVLTTGRNRG